MAKYTCPACTDEFTSEQKGKEKVCPLCGVELKFKRTGGRGKIGGEYFLVNPNDIQTKPLVIADPEPKPEYPKIITDLGAFPEVWIDRVEKLDNEKEKFYYTMRYIGRMHIDGEVRCPRCNRLLTINNMIVNGSQELQCSQQGCKSYVVVIYQSSLMPIQ